MSDREGTRPGWGPKDYWHIGPIYVRKRLALLGIIGLSATVLTIFGLPFPRHEETGEQPPAYRYDDPELAELSGLVQVLDGEGRVRYIGEVAAGAYTGRGNVYNAAGELLYDGPLIDGIYEGPDAKVYQAGVLVYTGEISGNLYEGQGRRINPATGVISEGQFSGGFLEGQGREFYADGTLLREGAFSHGLLEGEGCEYSPEGVLLREGTFTRGLLEGEGREYSPEGVLLREGAFSAGLLHGDGREYTSNGKLQYEGQFWRGIRHGQGDLYDTLQDVRSASGAFVYGELTGQGTLYHPSGQPLYTGQVCGGRPGADAFLGLSLAGVEAAFPSHWLLYTCEGTAAFVYPYYNLMFITESPVELVSPTQMEEAAKQERQELLDALKPPASEADAETETETETETGSSPDLAEEAYGMTDDAPAPAEPSQPPVYWDELLSPDTDKQAVIITRVLSYGQPLPGAALPEQNFVSGQHYPGWREWFSDFALDGTAQNASVRQSGQFIWRFTPSLPGDKTPVEEFWATQAGVETMTVRKEGKDMPLWYQMAQWGDDP